MAPQPESIKKIKQQRSRRMRRFGLNNSILSNVTVYLNPYTEGDSHLSAEDAAMYSAMAKYLNDRKS